MDKAEECGKLADSANAANLRRALEAYPGVDLALLFGSAARGTAGEQSDLDVAVSGRVDQLALRADLAAATGREVDVVCLAEVDIPLLEEILRDSRVLYERSAGAAASWRARALILLETDRPWFLRMQNAWLARVAAHGLPSAAEKR